MVPIVRLHLPPGRLLAFSLDNSLLGLFGCCVGHFVIQAEVCVEMIHATREGVVYASNEVIFAKLVTAESSVEVFC